MLSGIVPSSSLLPLLNATILARDVANERSTVMTPAGVEEVALTVAHEHGMQATVISGQALVDAGLLLFHAVGKAAM